MQHDLKQQLLMNEDKEDAEKDLEDIGDMQDQVHEGNGNAQGPDGVHTFTAENQAFTLHFPTEISEADN